MSTIFCLKSNVMSGSSLVKKNCTSSKWRTPSKMADICSYSCFTHQCEGRRRVLEDGGVGVCVFCWLIINASELEKSSSIFRWNIVINWLNITLWSQKGKLSSGKWNYEQKLTMWHLYNNANICRQIWCQIMQEVQKEAIVQTTFPCRIKGAVKDKWDKWSCKNFS